jgi:hypothetical protein
VILPTLTVALKSRRLGDLVVRSRDRAFRDVSMQKNSVVSVDPGGKVLVGGSPLMSP